MQNKNNMSATLFSKNIVTERKKQNLPVYNFGLGENFLPPPKPLLEYTKNNMHNKYYGTSDGTPELNSIIKKTYSNDNYKVNNIVIGNGLKELLYIVQLSFDGIIFHVTPSWVSYKEQIEILNKTDKYVEVPTELSDKFILKSNMLDLYLSDYPEQKKLIIFNNPSNPTGVYTDRENVKKIADVLRKHKCIVFSDEIYSDICFRKKYTSISEFIPELTIIGTAVSKQFACGGYRLGWITFPEQLDGLYSICKRNASSIYSSTFMPLQHGLAEFLKNEQNGIQIYLQNVNYIYELVNREIVEILSKSQLKFVVSDSSWYLFLNFTNYQDKLSKHNIKTSQDLCNYLIEKLFIVTVAGEHFNIDNLYLRISLVDFKANSSLEDRLFQEDITNESLEDLIDMTNMKQGAYNLVNFLEEL